MSKINDLHKKWMSRADYRAAHSQLAADYVIARAVIQARVKSGLTQQELADRMETTQSAIARLESGRSRPSTQTLQRLADATGVSLKITFEPRPTTA